MNNLALFLGVSLILFAKYVPFPKMSLKLKSAVLWVGMFLTGFFIGMTFYRHCCDFASVFHAGLHVR